MIVTYGSRALQLPSPLPNPYEAKYKVGARLCTTTPLDLWTALQEQRRDAGMLLAPMLDAQFARHEVYQQARQALCR